MQKHPSFEQLVEIFYKSDDELLSRFEPHLKKCESCKTTLAKMEQLLEDLRLTKEPSKEDIFTAKSRFINSTVNKNLNQTTEQKNHSFPVYLKYLAVAASIIAVVFISIAITKNSEQKVRKQTEQYAQVTKEVVDSSPAIEPKIMAMKGGCYIYEENNLAPLTKETRLVEGMILRLQRGGSIFAEFGAGNQLLFNEATFKILKATKNNIELDLFSGSIASKVAPLTDKQNFKISTSSVTTSVIGTNFAVKVLNTGVTLIAVKEGKVEVRPRDGSGSSMLVQAGETFRVDQMHLGYKKKFSEDKDAEPMFHPAKPYSVDKKEAEDNKAVAKAMLKEKPAPKKNLNSEARKMLEEATQLQKEKKYTDALSTLDLLLNKYPESLEAEQANYLKGENFLALDKIEDAAKAFEFVETNIENSNLVENAIYARAHILETRLKKPEAARALWHKYVMQYPNGMLKEDALYALCDNVSNSPMKVETFSVCSNFAKEFPKSFRTPTAILKAADAAWELNRFDSAAVLYESYTTRGEQKNMPPVLFRLGSALMKIGQSETAKQALKRLKEKYPMSEYSKKADEILKQ